MRHEQMSLPIGAYQLDQPSFDAALYRGDFMTAVDLIVEHTIQRMVHLEEPPLSARRARHAVMARLLLRATAALDGWSVSLARWMLEAALADFFAAKLLGKHNSIDELRSLDPGLHSSHEVTPRAIRSRTQPCSHVSADGSLRRCSSGTMATWRTVILRIL